MCLAAAVHTARLHEGHLSSYIILSALIFLFTLPHLLSIFTLPPPSLHLHAVHTLCSEPHGRDRPHFVFTSRSHLPQWSFPPSLLCPFVLLSPRFGEETRCEDLKPSASRKQRWDKQVRAFRRLIFAPPSAEHRVFSADRLLTEGHSSHFTQISR